MSLPELSVSWHKQIGHFAALGFCVVAPDMRGYGNSTVYDTYAIEEAVTDMLF
jgi:soluble epoxide hydrolase/lipid-phosphate phosphatase